MRNRPVRWLLTALLALLLVSGAGPTWAAPQEIEFENPLEVQGEDIEFEFLIPDDALLVYAMHSASVFSPDQYPQNAVFAQHNRATAQAEVTAMLEEDAFEIADLEVVGEPTVAVHRLQLEDEVIYLSSDGR